MRINFLFYNARQFDGYGRYSTRLMQALEQAGVNVVPHFEEALNAPRWLVDRWGISWDDMTISCLPPYFVQKSPGRHWLLTMTEGSELPDGWADAINKVGIERVIVPCQHNAGAFAAGGVECPITVIPGGTDPDEFPLLQYSPSRPYTFLAFADRGSRKGWSEVYTAFYLAFGGKTTGTQDVRLIVKCRPDGNDLVEMIAKAKDPDPRIRYQMEDVSNIAAVYAQADCVVLPSRSEGWGMPHREAAMMGLPVITQAYSGMDDGFTHQWALVVEGGRMERIAPEQKHIKGEWRRVDVDELAANMRACYDNPESAASLGRQSAAWLWEHQTWGHAASKLVELLVSEGVPEPEREFA